MGYCNDIEGIPSSVGVRRRASSRDHSVSAVIASTPELMAEVARIRHDAYVEQNFLKPIEGGLFYDKYDALPNFFSYLIMVDGVPAGSVRISFYDPNGTTPGADTTTAQEDFTSEIADLAETFGKDGRRATMMEMSRLVRNPRFSQNNSVVFGLYRVGFYCLLRLDPDMILSTTRRHHMPFYRRIGFTKITDTRPYYCLDFEIGLMACFRASYQSVQAKVPFFQGVTKDDEFYKKFFAGQDTSLALSPTPDVELPRMTFTV